jgi:carbon monoxide dehydrogenase subunit G
MELIDRRELEEYTMALQGQGPTGFVQGEGRIALADDAGGTRVSVDGDAQVGGTLAQIGSRMVETAVRMLMGQFFKAIDEEAQRAA